MGREVVDNIRKSLMMQSPQFCQLVVLKVLVDRSIGAPDPKGRLRRVGLMPSLSRVLPSDNTYYGWPICHGHPRESIIRVMGSLESPWSIWCPLLYSIILSYSLRVNLWSTHNVKGKTVIYSPRVLLLDVVNLCFHKSPHVFLCLSRKQKESYFLMNMTFLPRQGRSSSHRRKTFPLISP